MLFPTVILLAEMIKGCFGRMQFSVQFSLNH